MTLKQHIVVSGVTSAAFAYFSRSWPGAMACFLSGILIDLDHFWDYCIIKGKICWSVKQLEDYCFKEKAGKSYLILHSYELLVVLWIAVSFLKSDSVLLGFLLGMTVHMIFDQFVNPVCPLAYFLLYRAWFGFPKIIFLKDEFVEYLKKGGRHAG